MATATKSKESNGVEAEALPEPRTYVIKLEGLTDLLFGKPLGEDVEKRIDESHDQFMERTWKLRVHANKAGELFEPGIAFQKSLVEAAKRRGEKLQGRGQANFTNRFRQGVISRGEMLLTHPEEKRPLVMDDLDVLRLFVPLQPGKANSGRGIRLFPVLYKWCGQIELMVVDGLITEDVLRRHIQEAGLFLGIGTMRAANGHNHGRYKLIELTQTE